MPERIDFEHREAAVDLATWRARAERAGGVPKDRVLLDGPVIEALYTAATPERALRGRPGTPPFVRGGSPTRQWRIVQELRTAAALPDAVARAVEDGADAVRLGPAACVGLADAVDALVARAAGRPLVAAPGEGALDLARRPVAGLEVRLDPLGHLAASGGELGDALADTIGHVVAAIAADPSARPIEVDARPYHEAGATAPEEIALALAGGLAYLRALVDAGHPLADGPRRMSFVLALDADVFVGVAKLRAARLAWSKVLRTLGVDGPEQGMRLHAAGSTRGLSRLEPHTNLLRSTAAAFAAVAGGAEEVWLPPYDALAPSPSAHGARLATTTQLVLRFESHLGEVLDPAGGSYFIESLTWDLARRAWAVMQQIEHLGGLPRGLADGRVRDRLAASAAARGEQVATRARGLVAVNRYPSPTAPSAGSGDDEAGRGLAPAREAVGFERLRDRAVALPEAARQAAVLVIGDGARLRPRMEFAREALEVAGLAVQALDARSTAAEAWAALTEDAADARVVVAVASDEDGPTVYRELAARAGERVVLVHAGAPSDALREAGATRFLHLRMDALESLGAILGALETETP